MEQDELKRIMTTKAPHDKRLLIEIPKTDIGLHYSSITDYLDKKVNYDVAMMRKIDMLISLFRLGGSEHHPQRALRFGVASHQ